MTVIWSRSVFVIRRAKHEDARQIISAHVRSIREVCSKDYTKTQIDAWSGRNFREDIWRKTIDRDFVWVIELKEKVLGFGHVRLKGDFQATIEGLYFSPEAIGVGLGHELMTKIFDVFSVNQIENADLVSTITAKGFYLGMGFTEICETVVQFDEIPVQCVEMHRSGPFLLRARSRL